MQRGRFGHRPRNDPRYYGGEYPFIQTGNIVKASTANERIEFTQTLNELGLSTSRLFDEKVLVITIAANIGYTAILDYAACFPDSLVALTPKDDSLSLEYLNAYIRFIRIYIENLAPQAAQKNINLKQMSKLPIIVPDWDTQKLIVSIMEKAYTEKVKKENEAQALLGSINDYLLQELGITMPTEEQSTIQDRMYYLRSSQFIGQRFDQEYYSAYYRKLLNAIEKSTLKKLPLCQITQRIFNGSTPSATEYSEEKTEFPIIKVSSYFKNRIDLTSVAYSKSSVTKHIQQNDIFILSASHQSNYVGKFLKFLEDSPHTATGFVGELICVRANSIINSLVLFHILNLDIYKKLLNREKRGQTAHIYPNDISKIFIPIPDNQDEIEEKIRFIQTQANALANEAQSSIALAKQQIEKVLLGGKL